MPDTMSGRRGTSATPTLMLNADQSTCVCECVNVRMCVCVCVRARARVHARVHAYVTEAPGTNRLGTVVCKDV